MNPILKQLSEQGQSIWYDNIRRGMLSSGEMQALIDDGVLGVTSNPSIFQKAICDSSDYDDAIRTMVSQGRTAEEIYDALTIEDISQAASLFRPVYDRTNGRDGYVSIEVSPKLAFDTAGTISEAKRLFATLGHPNVMIKIPATDEGLPAITEALSEGINVNVTLIFSVDMYGAVMDAYLAGVEKYVGAGSDPSSLASVASFFVSRVDTMVDKMIGEQSADESLLGRAAVANSKMAYAAYEKVFGGERFASLKAKGAQVQRPLWASTSTKNPEYNPTIYVDTLVGPDTVNTVPPATLEAMKAGMAVEATLAQDIGDAERILADLETAGISMSKVTDSLRTAGVKAFVDSFDALLADVEEKRKRIAG